MVRLNMLPRQHGLGDPGKGEKKEKNEGPLTKDFCTPFTPLSGVFGQVVESRWLHMARMHRNGRRCSLYSIDCHIPKLDVAGSSPVSRSNLFNNLHASPNQLLSHLSQLAASASWL